MQRQGALSKQGRSRQHQQGRRPHRALSLGVLGLVLALAALPSAAFGASGHRRGQARHDGPGPRQHLLLGPAVVERRADQRTRLPGGRHERPRRRHRRRLLLHPLPAARRRDDHAARAVPALAVLLAHDLRDQRRRTAAFPSTSIYDEQINPDPGSVNPFRPGEDRSGQEPLLHGHDQRPADARRTRRRTRCTPARKAKPEKRSRSR